MTYPASGFAAFDDTEEDLVKHRHKQTVKDPQYVRRFGSVDAGRGIVQRRSAIIQNWGAESAGEKSGKNGKSPANHFQNDSVGSRDGESAARSRSLYSHRTLER